MTSAHFTITENQPQQSGRSRNASALFLLVVLLIANLSFTPLAPQIQQNSPRVAGASSSNVTVTVDVIPCDVKYLIAPEKRVSASTNAGEQVEIRVINPGDSSVITSNTVTANSVGQASVPTCPYSYFVEGNSYTVSVKGQSYLRKLYTNKVFSGFPNVVIDLTNSPLVAGDTDVPVGDNDVDYDDVKQLSLNMYTNNQRNDLNRDGIVNSLDLSNMITNLGLVGQ